jgi:hypothetical protein
MVPSGRWTGGWLSRSPRRRVPRLSNRAPWLLQAKTPLRGGMRADREPETWYQGPAAIRCVTESRGGVRKVW